MSGTAGVLEIGRSRFLQQDAEGGGFCFAENRVWCSGMRGIRGLNNQQSNVNC